MPVEVWNTNWMWSGPSPTNMIWQVWSTSAHRPAWTGAAAGVVVVVGARGAPVRSSTPLPGHTSSVVPAATELTSGRPFSAASSSTPIATLSSPAAIVLSASPGFTRYTHVGAVVVGAADDG